MSDVTRSAEGAQRASEAVLRSAGGRTVLVLVPQADTSGTMLSELGLGQTGLDVVELAPVVVRLKQAATATHTAMWELLVPGRIAEAVAGNGVEAVRAFFAGAAGVLLDGVVLPVVEVSYRDCAGTAYLYRVRLQMPAAGEV